MTQYAKTLPEDEQAARTAELQNRMSAAGISGTLILQKADMFYYTGTAQQGWLYVPDLGKPVLMVFKDFERAREESGFEQVVPLVSAKEIPDVLSQFGFPPVKHLGLELDVLTANQFLLFKKFFPDARISDISMEIRLQRAVKSPYEIGLMRQSSQMADKVAKKVPELLYEGIREIELAGLLEAYARRLGHQGLIRMRMWDSDLFYGHIMAGASAAVPSAFASPTGGLGLNPSIAQGPGTHTIKRNEPVLVDYVFVLNGYISDHTRIFSIGPLSGELIAAHEAMLEIQDAVIKAGKPGAVAGDLYDMMICMAGDRGYESFFMGAAEPRIRFTGHGIGLELDEFPFIAKNQSIELEKGMVIALEPKVVLPGKGVVGIENSFVVTGDGLEPLTTFENRIIVV